MDDLFEYFSYVCIYFVIVLLFKLLWSGRRLIRILLQTSKRDVIFVHATIGKMLPSWAWRWLTNETVFKSFDKLCMKRENRDRTCFYYQDEEWAYNQVQSMSFQVANFFYNLGYRRGDVIGLSMQNRPEVVCIWLGLSRIGVTTALINFNLRGGSLEHCLTAAKCKAVIFGSEMREAYKEIWITRQQQETPQTDVVLYELDRYFMKSPDFQHRSAPIDSKTSSFDFRPNDLASCLRGTSSHPTQLSPEDEKPNFMDSCLYIFTSGTTGMPKAAHSTHSRLTMLGSAVKMLGLTPRNNDVIYCPLPLYHTFALSGIIWSLNHGVPLVIVPKFSASQFWGEVHHYKVTACLYMGELCRFIVNQSTQPDLEKSHTLHTMYGCGVKPEVWKVFASRFNISKFIEAYGSTEGNCSMVNVEGKQVGAVGYIPVWMQPFYSMKIIKVDEVTGEIIRDKDTGYAVVCQEGEPGELVGKIVNYFPSLRYDGYTSKHANEKKIARDVFRRGDSYFRSGDLMTRDEYGYFYFKDRIGDTFRWKGENVSTAEVEGVILRLTGMKTTVVYGVRVPGTEGRAGMAAIADPDCSLDFKRLAEGMGKVLPNYARPVFIRVIRRDDVLNMTGTFKLQKFNLQKDGFDIERVSDPIFIYTAALQSYQILDVDMYKQIMQGSYRL